MISPNSKSKSRILNFSDSYKDGFDSRKHTKKIEIGAFMWWTMKNQQPNSQHIKFNCFFWERMYIWKLAVMISLFRGYGQIFVGTLLAQLTKYNKERGEIKEELL